nr:ATP-binding protein [Robbsia betulipollinis]
MDDGRRFSVPSLTGLLRFLLGFLLHFLLHFVLLALAIALVHCAAHAESARDPVRDAAASPPPVVTIAPQQHWPIDLRGHVEVHEDLSATADFAQIAALSTDAPHGFAPLHPDAVNPGFGRASWWLRFDVENTTRGAVTLRLALPSPWLHYVDFYVRTDQRWRHSRTGSAVPPAERDPAVRDSRLPAAAFELPAAGRAQIYVRISGAAPVSLLARLYSQAAYDAHEARAAYLVSALVGAVSLLAWSLLATSVLYRTWTFTYLAAMCGVQALNYLCVYGYARIHLWPAATEWAYRSPPILGLAILAVCTVALHAALRLQQSVSLGRRLHLGVFAVTLTLAAFAWLGDIRVATQVATLFSVVFLLMTTALMLLLYQRAVPTAEFMLAALVIATLIYALQIAQSQGHEPAFIERISVGITPEPLYDIFGLASDVIVFVAWIRHISRQRALAVRRLTDWQREEEQRLRREVATRTRELKEALLVVEEKNRQKIETLAFVGHDLRAPLATIAGYVKRLRREEDGHGDRGPAAATDAAFGSAPGYLSRTSSIEAIERSIDYQLSLIDELLEFSRGELQPLQLRVGAVRIGALLEEIADHAAALSAQRGNRLIFGMEMAVPALVRTDGKRLRQVLLNLLSNAAKFTRRGTITLDVRASMHGARADFHFAIADTGDGIDLQAQQDIFRAFHQIERSRGGVGLGLHIVERILREMHSGLHLQSTPGTGSRFSFDIAFPIVDATPHWCLPLDTAPVFAPAAADPLSPPPAPACAELLSLAEAGSLSALEDWLDDAARRYPAARGFCTAIREALERLDFERIVNLAGTGTA